METFKRKRGVVYVDAEHREEIMDWNTEIELEEDEGKEKEQGFLLIPPEWEVDKAADEFREKTAGGFQTEFSKLKFNIEVATFKLSSDDLIIDAYPPQSHEVWHFRPCDLKAEGELEKDNVFKTVFKELKKCPTLEAMKKEYTSKLFREPKTNQTFLKLTKGKEILYFTEGWMEEQLEIHRGIDIHNAEQITAIRDEAAFHLDMTINKLTDNMAADIVSAEVDDLKNYLKENQYCVLYAPGHDSIKMYFTEYGNIIDFGNSGETYERFAYSSPETTITLCNGKEVNLEDYLKSAYGVSLEGNVIDSGRGRPKDPPANDNFMSNDEGHQRRHDRELEDIEL